MIFLNSQIFKFFKLYLPYFNDYWIEKSLIIVVKYNKLSHSLWNEFKWNERYHYINDILNLKIKKKKWSNFNQSMWNLNREGTNEKEANHQHDISTYFL